MKQKEHVFLAFHVVCAVSNNQTNQMCITFLCEAFIEQYIDVYLIFHALNTLIYLPCTFSLGAKMCISLICCIFD